MASRSLTTRKMSDRHEEDLVAILGGERTRNSGAVWSDQGDGHQTGLDQYWRFGWDGKSTLGKSISITLDMLEKLREQCRGLEPMLPLRWYANDRLTEVEEDWIAIEAETIAAVLEDANAYRALLADTRHQIRFYEGGSWIIQHPIAERATGDLFSCPAARGVQFASQPLSPGTYYCTPADNGGKFALLTIEERIEDDEETEEDD